VSAASRRCTRPTSSAANVSTRRAIWSVRPSPELGLGPESSAASRTASRATEEISGPRVSLLLLNNGHNDFKHFRPFQSQAREYLFCCQVVCPDRVGSRRFNLRPESISSVASSAPTRPSPTRTSFNLRPESISSVAIENLPHNVQEAMFQSQAREYLFCCEHRGLQGHRRARFQSQAREYLFCC
jgi:hypothetical protein